MENFIINFSHALGWSITHSLWQASIWFIIYSIYTMFNPQLTAKAKHNAAFATQISIFISFIFTFIYFYQLGNQSIDLRNIRAEDFKNIVGQISDEQFRFENLLPYVVSGYLLGFIVQILLLTNSLLRLRTIKYKGLDSIPENWNKVYERAKQKLDVRQPVGLFLSKNISVPITLGHIKPFILFPIAYANKMDLAHVEAIILHELAHVKRQDYLFNLLKVGIETIMFFNPFIWALSKVLEREREHACDDMVVSHITTPLSYAQALVKLEDLRMRLNPALTLAATRNKNHLLNRIKRITKMETNYKNVRPQLIAVLLSGIGILTLAFLIPLNKSNAQEHQASETKVQVTNKVIYDTVRPDIPEPAQVPLNAKAPKALVIQQGNMIIDTVELPLEVRNKIRSIESNSKKIQEYYDSKEWKDKIAEINANAMKVQEKFNSPEWKAQMKKIEENSKKVTAYFESPEWKKQMENIEGEASKVQEYFNSSEWNNQIKKIEDDSKKVTAYFESPEWKQQMAQIEKEASKVQDHFNSPEWKKQIEKMEANGKKLEEYFKSPEWKKKEEEWKKLQNSPEYKEINKKYQKELEELRNKKGISKI